MARRQDYEWVRVFVTRGSPPGMMRALNEVAKELGHPPGRPDTTGPAYSIWVTEATYDTWAARGPRKGPKTPPKTPPKKVSAKKSAAKKSAAGG